MIPKTVKEATDDRSARISAYQAKLPGEVANLEETLAALTAQIQASASKVKDAPVAVPEKAA